MSSLTGDSSAVMSQSAVSLVEVGSQPMAVTVAQAHKVHDCTDLVDLARQVQKADEFVCANASSKLNVIAEEIQHLQDKARKVLLEARRDADLHHVACNLVKKPGTTYHLYSRPSGQRYFSILAPQEWGSSCPHDYLGSYYLELDMSWTPVEEMEEKKQKEQNAFITSCLGSQISLAIELPLNGTNVSSNNNCQISS